MKTNMSAIQSLNPFLQILSKVHSIAKLLTSSDLFLMENPKISEQKVKSMNVTLDMQFKNFRNAWIINSNGSIFLLNGIDLFVVNVQQRSENENNLKKIGSLGEMENLTISDIKVPPVLESCFCIERL